MKKLFLALAAALSCASLNAQTGAVETSAGQSAIKPGSRLDDATDFVENRGQLVDASGARDRS